MATISPCGGWSPDPATSSRSPAAPHTIRNESDTDAVASVVHAPGAPMEGFCRAVAAMAASGSEPDMDTVLATAAEHGIELLGPIPAVV